MRAITLTQPWATLVAIGAKKIETRSWSTSYRGPLLIHAGAGLGPVGGVSGLQELCCSEPFQTVLRGQGQAHLLDPSFFANNLPRGAIVAVAKIFGCVPTESARHIGDDDDGWSTERAGERWPLTDRERAFGDYSPGRYAWLLADVRPLRTPVPCKGALGLWVPPADVLAAVQAQLREENDHGA